MRSKLIIADPSLCDTGGHHFMTSLCLARAAGNFQIDAIIAANHAFVHESEGVVIYRGFSETIYREKFSKVQYSSTKNGANDIFVSSVCLETVELLSALNVNANDIVFFHTSTIRMVVSILEVFPILYSRTIPSFHFLFRYDPKIEAWAGEPSELKAVLTKLSKCGISGQIFLYGETHNLAAIYEKTLEFPVSVLLHFPTYDPAKLPEPGKRRPGDRLKVTYFGEARVEKGFDALPRSVATAYDASPEGFDFACQIYASESNRPGISSHVETLIDDGGSRAYKLLQNLDDDAYTKLLFESDVILAPHRVPEYTSRGSGIFVDAFCSGAIVLVRAGTWMSRFGGTPNVIVFESDEDLAAKIASALSCAARYVKRPPRSAAILFSVNSNIDSLLRNHVKSRVGKDDRVQPARGRRNALLITPWWPKQGSSRVFQAQTDMLRDCGFNIFAVTLIPFPTDCKTSQGYDWMRAEMGYGPLAFHWLCFANSGVLELLGQVAHQIVGRDESWLAEMFSGLSITFPPSLIQFCRDSPPDFILCNYVHNIPVARLLNPGKVPVIVETHDIRSKQHATVYDELGPPPDLSAEIRLARAADGLVFINSDEAGEFEAGGVTMACRTLLPATRTEQDGSWVGDLKDALGEKAWAKVINETVSLLRRAFGSSEMSTGGVTMTAAIRDFVAGRTKYCAFVGSVHKWNIKSISRFYKDVFVRDLRPLKIKVILVGSIATWFRKEYGDQKDVLLIDWLPNLQVLYKSGIPIVLPITGGTGFPIKTLEALQAGSVMIGTPEAVRGFEWLSGAGIIAPMNELGAAIVRAVGEPGSWRAFTDRRFSWEYYRDSWASLIEEVTGSPTERGCDAPPANGKQMHFAARTDFNTRSITPLRLDHVLELSVGTQDQFYASSFGFSRSYSDFDWAWSSFPYFGFIVAEVHRGQRLSVEICNSHSTAVNGLLKLLVFVDGVPTSTIDVGNGAGAFAVDLPAKLSVGGDVLVELFAPNAHQGLTVGSWTDQRILGIAIRKLAIGAVADHDGVNSAAPAEASVTGPNQNQAVAPGEQSLGSALARRRDPIEISHSGTSGFVEERKQKQASPSLVSDERRYQDCEQSVFTANALPDKSDGFHGLEYTPKGTAFRWTGPRSESRFSLSIDRSHPVVLSFQIVSLGDNRPPNLTAEVDGEPYPLRQGDNSQFTFTAGPLSARTGDDPTKVTLRVPRLRRPSENGAKDTRTLGIALAWIRAEPAKQS